MITVVKPGLQTTIQDLGRPGHYAMGMPPSGALDRFSHSVANALVGNPAEYATLEATLLGPELRFESTALVAVTGAEVEMFLDGATVDQWTAVRVDPGQVLSFGRVLAGTRFYIAVRGGVDVVPFLGSRSTYTTAGVGGLRGKPLIAGDELPIGEPGPVGPVPGVGVAEALRPKFPSLVTIRVVEGLCQYRFTPESMESFFSSEFAVMPESNRTGYRLDGPALEFADREAPFGAGDNPSNVVDLGYPIGSIQVPNGTQLIALLRDAVTGGGYATLGTIISADVDAIGQAKTPDRIRFTSVSVEEAIAARRVRAAQLATASVSIAAGPRP